MAIATRDLAVGYEFPSRVKTITLERANVYADLHLSTAEMRFMVHPKSIYNDDAFAKRHGLPGPVVAGMTYATLVSAMLVDLFGEGYVKGGKLHTKFIKLVRPGDALTLRAIVTDKAKEGSAVRFNLEVRCENQRGEPVLVGTASALVP
ncbi:MAG: MaoC family dehydratase [Chloroflexota bacterium]|nr:MaoC family dehydratase [Chloroflexota bacterium]